MSHNLRLKSSAFSEHFSLILLFILKKLGSPAFDVERNDKTPAAYKYRTENRRPYIHKLFKGKCAPQSGRNWRNFPLKRLCTEKHCPPSNRTYKLQRLWHIAERETNILQRNLSFGVKMFAKR